MTFSIQVGDLNTVGAAVDDATFLELVVYHVLLCAVLVGQDVRGPAGVVLDLALLDQVVDDLDCHSRDE